MKKHFYSHIVEIDSLVIKLDQIDLSEKEKQHLILLAESSIHNSILDVVLSELTHEDKKVFLNHLMSDDHEKIWQFIEEKIENIEEKIKETVNDLKIRLHKDIAELAE